MGLSIDYVFNITLSYYLVPVFVSTGIYINPYPLSIFNVCTNISLSINELL